METFDKLKFPQLFKRVASVLGEEGAMLQLSKAWDGYGVGFVDWDDPVDWVDSPFLSVSFIWAATPQGARFWEAIDDNKGEYHD